MLFRSEAGRWLTTHAVPVASLRAPRRASRSGRRRGLETPGPCVTVLPRAGLDRPVSGGDGRRRRPHFNLVAPASFDVEAPGRLLQIGRHEHVCLETVNERWPTSGSVPLRGLDAGGSLYGPSCRSRSWPALPRQRAHHPPVTSQARRGEGDALLASSSPKRRAMRSSSARANCRRGPTTSVA